MTTTEKRNKCDKYEIERFKNGYKIFMGTGGNIKKVNKQYHSTINQYPLTPNQMFDKNATTNQLDKLNDDCICDKCHPKHINHFNNINHAAGNWTPSGIINIKKNNNKIMSNLMKAQNKKHVKNVSKYIQSFNEIPFRIRKKYSNQYKNTLKYMNSDIESIREFAYLTQNRLLTTFEKLADKIQTNQIVNQKSQFNKRKIKKY